MTQPHTGARESSGRAQDSCADWDVGPLAAGHADSGSDISRRDPAQGPGAASPAEPSRVSSPGEAAPEQGDTDERRQPGALPPGQYIPRTLPVLHYGPVPAFNREIWDLRIFGSTASGEEGRLNWDDVREWPAGEVTADFHCVTKFTVPQLSWSGIMAGDLLARFEPAPAVTHVMIWADFGYSANVRMTDFAADDTILATHRNGEPLTPEHGYPLRLVVPSLYAWKSVKWVRAIEYMTADRRGFWEERGYHNVADPWREQRYSYQEMDGEGPPL
jgi:DMSO/TMAO reductase YedYZ molybdopterin-dependent catalytic subunit